jgi:hypothetical protein
MNQESRIMNKNARLINRVPRRCDNGSSGFLEGPNDVPGDP